MNKYTYSFIIPHHNAPELLNRCLDSIPRRDDIQIVVVDDNSHDDKKPVLSRSDVKIIYIDADHTKGAGHARNIGMAEAKGRWLLFADCDDYYTENFINVLDRYKDSTIDVLFFNYLFLDNKGKILSDNKLQKYLMSYNRSKEQTDYIKYRNNTPWTKMVSHDYVTAHNMYFEEVVNGNDVLFSLFVAHNTNNVEIIPERLYCYIKTPNSIGTKRQSLMELQCRIDHVIKHNAFNKSIGHKEWNSSVYKFLYGVCSQYGLVILLKLMPSTFYHMLSHSVKQHWCKIIS